MYVAEGLLSTRTVEAVPKKKRKQRTEAPKCSLGSQHSFLIALHASSKHATVPCSLVLHDLKKKSCAFGSPLK